MEKTSHELLKSNKIFSYCNFFDLCDFEYRFLWESEKVAWAPLGLLQSFLLNYSRYSIKSKISENVYIEDDKKVCIGKNVTIEKGVYIKGPCIIGDNSVIRHGAYIRENVIIGKNSLIGHASEVKNSILLDNSSAAHFAYIGDSIIGNNVNLGAHVTCANFRLDKKRPSLLYNGKFICIKLEKLGSIIGDNCSIGCSVVLNPASFLLKNTTCNPLSSVKGIVGKNE